MGAQPLAIRAEGLWKTYRIHPPGTPRRLWRHPTVEFHALKDVNFEVPEGAVLGIVGHNGAGKSTLLKVLSRITDPSRGQVKVAGRVASLLEVGTGFHPELTGMENLYLNAAIHGLKRRDVNQRLDSILAFAEIGEFLHEPVKHYSSGMYLRLAFSVAAHLDPDILIVDELLAVGDARFRERCLGKMREVAGSGRTVVLVSHDAAAIRALCTHALHLERGARVALGPTEGVLGGYLAALARADGITHHDAGALALASRRADGTRRPEGGHAVHVELTLDVLRDVRGLWVDFVLEGPSGVRLLQAMPSVLGAPRVDARAGQQVRLALDGELPPLPPGAYRGTMYAQAQAGDPLLHVAGMRLFEVAPDPAHPECLAPSFSAVLLPKHALRLDVVR